MALIPLGNRVALQTVEISEQKVGGIFIPDSAKEKPQVATIVALGKDEELNEALSVGDQVLYAKYSGTEIEHDGQKYIIISFDDILAIVK